MTRRMELLYKLDPSRIMELVTQEDYERTMYSTVDEVLDRLSSNNFVKHNRDALKAWITDDDETGDALWNANDYGVEFDDEAFAQQDPESEDFVPREEFESEPSYCWHTAASVALLLKAVEILTDVVEPVVTSPKGLRITLDGSSKELAQQLKVTERVEEGLFAELRKGGPRTINPCYKVCKMLAPILLKSPKHLYPNLRQTCMITKLTYA